MQLKFAETRHFIHFFLGPYSNGRHPLFRQSSNPYLLYILSICSIVRPRSVPSPCIHYADLIMILDQGLRMHALINVWLGLINQSQGFQAWYISCGAGIAQFFGPRSYIAGELTNWKTLGIQQSALFNKEMGRLGFKWNEIRGHRSRSKTQR
jgi:hypothetical protein